MSVELKKINKNLLQDKKHIHFIGIGGSGMYPLVQIMHSKGYKITGSDINETDTVEAERKMGITVTIGQTAENIAGADLIVFTTAVLPENPELVAAKAGSAPLIERAELLALITGDYDPCICVSGTHGKTTTSSILTEILMAEKFDPTAVIGGKLPSIGGSGRIGAGDIMVCEACEFSEHHLLLDCDIAVILNIDADHLEYYGTFENLAASFTTFAKNSSRLVIINADDANTVAATASLGDKLVTFGFEGAYDFSARNLSEAAGKYIFDLYMKEEFIARLALSIPGKHGVINTLAAVAAAVSAGADPERAARAAERFGGVGRRFEILGEVGGVTIADDYAHHPAELAATLASAKKMPYKKVWAVFQPFTFSRTKLLLDDFAEALAIADRVVMTEIMGGRELNTYNIYTKDLAEKLPGSIWFESFEEIRDFVLAGAEPGDLVITLGCGDINKCAKLMLQQ